MLIEELKFISNRIFTNAASNIYDLGPEKIADKGKLNNVSVLASSSCALSVESCFVELFSLDLGMLRLFKIVHCISGVPSE